MKKVLLSIAMVMMGATTVNAQKADVVSQDLSAVKAKYDKCEDFHEGLARVRKNNKFGFIDEQGNEIVPPIYDIANDFSEGLAVVVKFGKRTYIPCVEEKVHLAKYGYIDKQGNVVIPLIYDAASNFKEGIAMVGKNVPGACPMNTFISCDASIVTLEQEGRFGLINNQGEIKLPICSSYDDCQKRAESFK